MYILQEKYHKNSRIYAHIPYRSMFEWRQNRYALISNAHFVPKEKKGRRDGSGRVRGSHELSEGGGGGGEWIGMIC
jgi:hypothetical protein